MRHRLTILLFVTLFFLVCPESRAGQSLTLWIHPYLPATELTKRFTPLAAYLSEKIQRPVEIRIQKSYQDHLDFVGQDQADIAYLGPAPYVLVRDKYGPKPLLARLEVRGSPVFHGMIITRSDSTLRSLADIADKSFAFGDVNSTMSHIVPRGLLARAGVTVDRLARYEFMGTHHDVALGVLGGYFDAGAVKEEVFYEYEKRGLRMLAKSPPIPEHLFVTRSTLAQPLVERLREALLAINTFPQKQDILTSIKKSVTGLAPVIDRDYDTLRQLMNSYQQ